MHFFHSNRGQGILEKNYFLVPLDILSHFCGQACPGRSPECWEWLLDCLLHLSVLGCTYIYIYICGKSYAILREFIYPHTEDSRRSLINYRCYVILFTISTDMYVKLKLIVFWSLHFLPLRSVYCLATSFSFFFNR